MNTVRYNVIKSKGSRGLPRELRLSIHASPACRVLQCRRHLALPCILQSYLQTRFPSGMLGVLAVSEPSPPPFTSRVPAPEPPYLPSPPAGFQGFPRRESGEEHRGSDRHPGLPWQASEKISSTILKTIHLPGFKEPFLAATPSLHLPVPLPAR